ncbi:MAG: hypothetical protein ACSHX3_08860 [Litorimonas sp.]
MKLPSIFISLFLSVTVVTASWMSCCAGLSALSDMVTTSTSYHQVTPVPDCHNEPAQNITSATDEVKSIQGGQLCEGCADCQFTVIIESPSFLAAHNMSADHNVALLPDISIPSSQGKDVLKNTPSTPYPNLSSVDGRFIETDLYLI